MRGVHVPRQVLVVSRLGGAPAARTTPSTFSELARRTKLPSGIAVVSVNGPNGDRPPTPSITTRQTTVDWKAYDVRC